jgi:hypothetical protein
MISLRVADDIPGALRKRPGRVVLGLCSAHLFWATAAYSQRWMTSFGPYQECRTDHPPVALAVCRLSHDTGVRLLAASADSPHLTVYSSSDSTTLAPLRSIETSTSSSSLTCADIDGDGVQECIALSTTGRTVGVFHILDARVREDTYHLNARPQRCAVGDINGDRRPDILLYGQTMTGILTLLGSAQGKFKPGPLLFPDVSCSDICLVDLNGDRLTDVLLLDWLSEKLVVKYGVGQGIFAEEVRIQLPSEPGRLSAMAVTAQRTFRIVVTMPQAHAVAHIIRDVYGEFSIKETIDVHGRPRDVVLTLINGDLLPDLVSPTSSGIYIGLGISALGFDQGTIFGAGTDASCWALADQNLNHLPDLVFGDRSAARLSILKNARTVHLPPGPLEYAVGSQPGALALGDFNTDGLMDVIVANERSSTLSVLLNEGGGRFDGQVAWTIADQPGEVHVLPSTSTKSSIVLTTHSNSRQIGVAHLSTRLGIIKTFAVPTGPNPTILHAEELPVGGRLSILVKYRDQKRGEPYVAMLEQLSGSQFVEHSFRANLPVHIAALGAGAFFSNASRGLVFVTRQKGNSGSAIYVAPATASPEGLSVRPVLTFVDSTSTIQAAVAADFDHDGTEDLALFRSLPDNSVGIAYGKGEGAFAPVRKWVPGVNPDQAAGVAIRDVNNDDLPDITWVDHTVDSVFVLFSKAHRSLSLPKGICSASGVSGIAIGHITDAPTPDLILCRNARHSISLISAPFAP